ncbi:hypothetical protein DFA_02495 [Cavenderia fasciculata]|uniref:Uncharacterized protein n=1 Tax=Cavenderia fasciculata TaxID=261658 RepID=F4Q076_CACFS|nr:uncharacterized protein DFA_02495 [Cavenderia fasciculata]EGG18756.1 hypothetical protein DFA_02495 [Cavenderia fasciculata]|eukprot:XP_004357218.1 hypothetical protein DFA_02495 [Cavenderia fasciculata]
MFLTRRKRSNTISIGSTKKINNNGSDEIKCHHHIPSSSSNSLEKVGILRSSISQVEKSKKPITDISCSQNQQQEGATEVYFLDSSKNNSENNNIENIKNNTTTNNNNNKNNNYINTNNNKNNNLTKNNNNNNNNNDSQYSKQSQNKMIRHLIKKLTFFTHKKKESDPRVQEFLRMIETHKEFFKRAPEFDKYILTLAYVLLNRAYPEAVISTELFFHTLYLAWETEEDSTLGLESIIHYVIGSYPSRNKEKNQRKQEIQEWRMRLRNFHTGKDILWRDLDFRTMVEFPQLSKISKSFDFLNRDRTYSQSIKFF